MAELECVVATPEGPIFDGRARSVVVPAFDGELGILPLHAPLVAALGCGELRLDTVSDGKQSYYLAGGFVQVLGGRVIVLATEVENVEKLDAEVAQKDLDEVLGCRPASGGTVDDLAAYREELSRARTKRKLAG
jgi:F-type H+-transporting ATPase subunit epsilon